MIQRKADDRIREFLLHDKRSLLVTGARQVGKTFSIRKVGKECFENFIEINFVEQPDAIELFNNGKNAKDLLMRAGLTFSKMFPFDQVVEQSIRNGILDIDQINLILFEKDSPLLGQKEKG